MMKQRTTYLLFFFLAIGTTLFAQPKNKLLKKRLRQAKKQLSYENYQLALPVFQDLWKLDSNNTEINFGLAKCLYVVRLNKQESFKYFKKSLSDYPKAYYYLGILYRYRLKFEASKQCFLNYKKTLTNQMGDEYDETMRQLSKTQMASESYKAPQEVIVRNLGENINSPYPDYAPFITPDEQSLYFTSRRPNLEHPERDPYGFPFEDIYVSNKRKGKWEQAENIETPVNSSIHDACLGFSKDGQIMYIYRTEPDMISGDIYISKFENTQWSIPRKYTKALNYPYSTEASLTITQDEQTIYFSSDRAGGYGGKDLYRITRLPNGQWSLPLNLGAWINTPYDEDAPYVALDGRTLYFSSKGHEGLGDYDIYVTHMDSNGIWQQPKNLGYPINTVFNDIFFIQSYDGKTNYFSSDRPEGLGSMDNYEIQFPDFKRDYVLLQGRVVRKDNSFIVNLSAVITVIDKKTNKLQGIYRTNKRTGKYVLALLPRHYYKIIVELNGYYTFVANIDLRKSNEELKQFKYIMMTEKTDK